MSRKAANSSARITENGRLLANIANKSGCFEFIRDHIAPMYQKDEVIEAVRLLNGPPLKRAASRDEALAALGVAMETR